MPPEPPDEPEVPAELEEPVVKFSSRTQVKAWLLRIAKNKAVDHYRKEKQHQKKKNKLNSEIKLGTLKTKKSSSTESGDYSESTYTCVRTRDFFDGEYEKKVKDRKEENWWAFFRDLMSKLTLDDCFHCLLSRFYEIRTEFAGNYIAGTQVNRANLVRDCRDVCPSLNIPNEERARHNATSKLEECLNKLEEIAHRNGYTLEDYDPRKS